MILIIEGVHCVVILIVEGVDCVVILIVEGVDCVVLLIVDRVDKEGEEKNLRLSVKVLAKFRSGSYSSLADRERE